MIKKAAKWIAKNILWPLLREILVESLKLLVKYAFDRLKQLLAKWQSEEEQNANSEAEKEAVRKKYESRSQDLDDMKEDIADKISDIVDNAMEKVESERDKLLDEKQNEPKELLSGEEGVA